MEPFGERLYSESQRLPARAEPSHHRHKEPPLGLGCGPFTRQGAALGRLVCRGIPAARSTLGAAGRGVCLREESGSEATSGGGIEGYRVSCP